MTTNPALAHYGTEPLWRRVHVALRSAGLDADGTDWPAFAPLDEFHTRGLLATRELAQALDPGAGESVLDVGSGLGGPARLLAAEFGCDVTGIDLNPEFVDVAIKLTALSGLDAGVRFRQADALSLPFPDGAFDHVVTQHVAMNIADRPRLYQEVRRVIRDGGRFAIHDVVAGDGRPLCFPVPWSRTPDTSFLLTAEQTRAAVAEAGFDEVLHRDETEVSAEWFQALSARPPRPGVGLAVIMGPGFAEMSRNLAANLARGRVGVIQLVARAAG